MSSQEDTAWRYDLKIGHLVDSKHDGEWGLANIQSLSTTNGCHDKDTVAVVLALKMVGKSRKSRKLSFKLSSPDIQQAYAKTGTPLHRAALEGHLRECDQLIKLGAEVNAKCKIGFTPLTGAASNGHTDVCALLIAQGADINTRDELDITPLHMSASAGQFGVCELLLRLGAQVNAQARNAITPLQMAAWNDHTEVCGLLTRRGAIRHHAVDDEEDEKTCDYPPGGDDASPVFLRLSMGEGLPRWPTV